MNRLQLKNRIIPIQDKWGSIMLLYFWLSSVCYIAIGDNICGQNNGGCEQLCLPSSPSTIQCACADGFQLENDGKRCLDIGKYCTIILQVDKYSWKFVSFKLASVYVSTLSFVISSYWILNLCVTNVSLSYLNLF